MNVRKDRLEKYGNETVFLLYTGYFDDKPPVAAPDGVRVRTLKRNL
jgi:hypothetical protein